ncbi:MAG: hypothetical protein CMH86_07185 [Oceanibulbus sp.]|nr:hypothetical protein [Sulfitobacter sp.]
MRRLRSARATGGSYTNCWDTAEEIDKLRALMPDLKVQLLVGEGQNLSELVDQDSYSFELMDVFLGGESADFIEDAYKRCRDSLVFLIKPMDDAD